MASDLLAAWLDPRVSVGGSTLGFTFLGEGLRDAIDPSLRREL